MAFWTCQLEGWRKATVEGITPADGIEAYKRQLGIRSTIHPISAGPASEEEIAAAQKEMEVADLAAAEQQQRKALQEAKAKPAALLSADAAELRELRAKVESLTTYEQRLHRLEAALESKLANLDALPAQPAEAKPAEAVPIADPTLADMGIVGESAELLAGEGLLTRSAIVAFAKANGGLAKAIKGIGPQTELEINRAVKAAG